MRTRTSIPNEGSSEVKMGHKYFSDSEDCAEEKKADKRNDIYLLI